MLTQICCSNQDLSIVPWWVLSYFLASLSLWLMNENVRNCWRGVNELYGLYLLCYANGQMHLWLIALSVKSINKHNVFLCLIQVNQDNFILMLRLIYMFLGYNLLIQLLLKSITSHAWTNRLTLFSTCSLPIQLLLCINIIVYKHLTTSIIK